MNPELDNRDHQLQFRFIRSRQYFLLSFFFGGTLLLLFSEYSRTRSITANSVNSYSPRISRKQLPNCVYQSPVQSNSLNIALVLFAEPKYISIYNQTIADQQCYAARNGYRYILQSWKPSKLDVMFAKLRIIQSYQRYYDVVVGMDADVFVANHSKRIEEYLNDQQDVYLQGRFNNNEIMAAMYIIRTTPWSIQWVNGWLAYSSRSTNGDNGALHIHLVRTLLQPSHPKYHEMEKIWDSFFSPKPLTGYLEFVLEVRQLIDNPDPKHLRLPDANKIIIFRELHGFARVFENGLTRTKEDHMSPTCHSTGFFWCKFFGDELFVHSKKPKDYLLLPGMSSDSGLCPPNQVGPITHSPLVFSSTTEAKEAVKKAAYQDDATMRYFSKVAANCFPNCTTIWPVVK